MNLKMSMVGGGWNLQGVDVVVGTIRKLHVLGLAVINKFQCKIGSILNEIY